MSASPNLRLLSAALTGLGLLVLFILWNRILDRREQERIRKGIIYNEREALPDTSGLSSRRLIFYDFEWGNPKDTAAHIIAPGRSGRQSFLMRPWIPFSPGLWIRFRDLKAKDSSWIRVEGWVRFTCLPVDLKTSLVATCNHNGINYKYMSFPLEPEQLEPDVWNRVILDYRIPEPPDLNDILQAYFWNRGTEKLWVDDFSVCLYEKKPQMDREKY